MMMNEWVTVVVAVIALGGPVLAYLTAIRKTQGRIRSSDAAELWEESSAIRRECAERVKFLEHANLELQQEVYRLQRAVAGGGEV